MRRGLYIETLIQAGIEDVWRLTQRPELHERWDLRFTRITRLPAPGQHTVFHYATRVLPGLVISGTGVTVGERFRPDGTRTSALRFASPDQLSLIREGSGYWRYVVTGSGVRFLTGYDYRPGWGRLGAGADLLLRPLMGWATAWSFDRLRLWLERGIPPRAGLRHAMLEALLRAGALALAVLVLPAWLALPLAAAALLLPPSPYTPAARRCLRRPPDRVSARPPSTLDTLELP